MGEDIFRNKPTSTQMSEKEWKDCVDNEVLAKLQE